MVFRCLSFTAIKSTDRNKGKTANHEDSGTAGVGVGVRLDEDAGCVWSGVALGEVVGCTVWSILVESIFVSQGPVVVWFMFEYPESAKPPSRV